MGFKCGIVGLPNVGKSTLFNVLTFSNKAEVANYPFCTITPNIGIAQVFDSRIFSIDKLIHAKKKIFSFIEFVDIAGLVEGASRGDGLGNQFLKNIGKVDAIIHVVRCFLGKEDILHVNNKVDPIEDAKIVDLELVLADISLCEKSLLFFKKKKKKEKKKIFLLNKCKLHLQKNNSLRTLLLDEEEEFFIKEFNFLTKKPIMYVGNIDGFVKSKKLFRMFEKFFINQKIMCLSVDAGLEYKKLQDVEKIKKNKFFKKNNSLNKIISFGYTLLNLNTFFTVGEKEIRAWTFRKNSTAINVAKIIHSDFSRGFIRVKVISYNDFIFCKGEKKAKLLGKVRFEGKNYIVKDGDILYFLFKI